MKNITTQDITIRAAAAPQGRTKPASFLPCLFLLAGLYGVLPFLRAAGGDSVRRAVLYPAVTVLCLLLWYLYTQKRNLFSSSVLALGALFCAAVLLFRRRIWAQLTQIGLFLLGRSESAPAEAMAGSLFLAVLFTVFLFFFEIVLQSHVLPFLATTALLLLAPLFGIRTGFLPVLLILFFQITFWGSRLTGRAAGRRRFHALPVADRPRLITEGCILICLALAGASLLSLLLNQAYSQDLYRLAYDGEGFFYRTLQNASGRSEAPIAGGEVSRGNTYYTGTPHLELETSVLPSEVLYLNGFSGGDYTGSEWLPADDNPIFDKIGEQMGWGEWSSLIDNMFYNLYYIVNYNTADPPDPLMLILRHYNDNYENYYVPYNSWRQPRWDNGRVIPDRRYVYYYYEQKDMHIDWTNRLYAFQSQQEWYRDIQLYYQKYAQESYTQVPEELLPRLRALVEEHPLENINEITAFILYTLENQASYSMTPGWASVNQDIAEYFLFESHSGYCVHYATAATLLYRLYGIPARYAAGYRVSPVRFKLQEDGLYHATVTDEHAHAWVEIFLEDYGWVPVEVTPTSYGTFTASYPGFDMENLSQILKEHGWEPDASAPQPEAAGVSRNTAAVSAEDPSSLRLPSLRDLSRRQRAILAGGFTLLLLAAILTLCLHRRRLLARWKTAPCRPLYSRLLRLLHDGGYLTGYDGSEEDFPARLAEAVPTVGKKDALRVTEIVGRAAYSPHAPEDAENAFVHMIYDRVAIWVCAQLKGPRRWLFRYLRVYL